MSLGDTSRYRSLPQRDQALRLALVGVGLLVPGVMLAVAVATFGTWVDARDLGVNTWFFELGASNGWLEQVATWLSWIGRGERTLQVVIVVSAVLVVARQWRWAVFLVVCSQTGALISTGIKHAVGRPRPPFGDFDASQLTSSFPSGHTFAGVTAWVAMGIIVLYVLPRPWSTMLAVVPLVIGIANGPSRLVLGRHWVTDVLGAWLLASGWLLVVWAAFVWLLASGASRADHDQSLPSSLPADAVDQRNSHR
jgi:undecaprenyl-diphosphatase